MSTPPLVLVPGLLCDAAVWQLQVDAVAPGRELQVANYGLATTLSAMAERILAAAPPQFALAGHSMGGRVALEIHAQAPGRVTHLALLDTGYDSLPPGDAGARERAGRYRLLEIARRDEMLAMGKEWARGMVYTRRLRDASLMDSIHHMVARATAGQFEAQIHALPARPDRSHLLPTIRVPCLVLCGREDSWSPLARHEEMARLIPGSVLVDVPECGHMSTMERPAAITRALLDWLNR